MYSKKSRKKQIKSLLTNIISQLQELRCYDKNDFLDNIEAAIVYLDCAIEKIKE